jgi:hypothetical protein
MRFKFGDKVKMVFSSADNPRRTAFFVRATGRKNGPLSFEVTDGEGHFWGTSPRSTVIASMPDDEAEILADKLWLEDNRHIADPALIAKVEARLATLEA